MDEIRYTENQGQADAETEARRLFIKKVGRASAVAPAVALLIAANLKSAQAQSQYGSGGGSGSGSSD